MATKKDVEVGFNSSTRITKGEGSGEAVTEAELATNWNVAIFLLKSSQDNIAQKIQMISEKKAE